MPQGKRKIPFSGKKKKEQLHARRQRKGGKYTTNLSETASNSSQNETSDSNMQRISARSRNNTRQNRYAIKFFQESRKNIAQMKRAAFEPLKMVEFTDREANVDYFETYDFPVRPPWHYLMSNEELEINENRYFDEYVNRLLEHHSNTSLFELNLENWRQLWRVLEISDIILIIVDVRYSQLMFPPSLFVYITKTLEKEAILVLNKIDLVEPEVVIAWKQYFLENYQRLSVALFTSQHIKNMDGHKCLNRRSIAKNKGKCVLELFNCVNKIVGPDLDLSMWEEKILSDLGADEMETIENSSDTQIIVTENSLQPEVHTKYKNGVVTIGCVGFPNVGKSSIINALKGAKVVSVSRTPGHTKYFQTIFLTKNVKLCDCPGLVFPSSLPKSLQVILGSYPISQLQEPYATIRFVGERINLPDILSLSLPDDYSVWSPVAICEAWALKRGFLTAKAARPDTYRAANNILRLVLQGKLSCTIYPAGFLQRKDYWKNHPGVEEVRNLFTDNSNICSVSGQNRSLSDVEVASNSSSSASFTTEEIESSNKDVNAFSLLDDE